MAIVTFAAGDYAVNDDVSSLFTNIKDANATVLIQNNGTDNYADIDFYGGTNSFVSFDGAADVADAEVTVTAYYSPRGGLFSRFVDANNNLSTRLAASGDTFWVQQLVSGTPTNFVKDSRAIITDGDKYVLKQRFVGNDLKVMAWLASDPEPDVWEFETSAVTHTTSAKPCVLFSYDARAAFRVTDIEVRTGSDISGQEPSVTIDPASSPLTPGATFNFTYSNYDTVPTTLTGTRGSNVITSAGASPQITGLNITDNGDGTGSGTATLVSLPTSGTLQFLQFSDSGAGIDDPVWELS